MKKDTNIKYEDVRAVNNTALGYFLVSPLEFKKYYDNPTGGKGEWYDIGSAIHCILLQPETFDDKFIILDYNKPKNEQQKLFCEIYCSDTERSIINSYSSAYKTASKSEKKIKDEAEALFGEMASYIQFLEMESDKTVLSTQAMNVVRNCVGSLMANPKASFIVKTTESSKDEINVYNELEIYFDYKSVKCKSKIDRLIIDRKKRIVYIVDFKTTSKQINKFKESFIEYDYERQFSFYAIAVFEYLSKQKDIPGLDDYTVYFICPIVSTKEPFESRIYALPTENIQIMAGKIKSMFDDLDWHFNTNNWNYPKCYYEEGEDYEMLDY